MTAPEGEFTERVPTNLEVFVRLLGYVRYFHPSDQVAEADWEAFTLEHLLDVERVQTDEELAVVLEHLFGPYAPTLDVYLKGQEPPLHEALQPRTEPCKVRMWVHSPHGKGRGYDLPERVTGEPGGKYRGRTPSDVEVTVDLPYPHEVARLELGRTICVNLALTLYEDGGIPPQAASAVVGDVQAVPRTAAERSFRLSVIAFIWNHYRHFFAYFDQIDTDWDAVLTKALKRAARDDETSFLATYRWLNAQLRDAHNFSGLKGKLPLLDFRPPFHWRTAEGQLTVFYAAENSPLAVGDIVVKIGGLPSDVVLSREEALLSQTGDGARRLAESIVLSGAEGTRLDLEVESASGLTRAITVTRTFDRRGLTPLHMDNRPGSPVARLGSGVVYLDLTRLDDKTDVYTGDAATHELSALVTLLAEADGLIFDMRGYPGWTLPIELLGHLSEQPLRTAPMYMPVITRPDAEMMLVDITYEWAQPKTPRFTRKVVFLINSTAASRTEHILAMVEGYRLGDLLGTPTAGANGTYAGVTFFDLYTSSWSSIKANRFGDEQLFAKGVPPTVPVARTVAGIRAGRDEQLERAFERVSGQPTDAMRVETLDLPGAPPEP
jgi:C-terminal processing protease CtpA/Prc